MAENHGAVMEEYHNGLKCMRQSLNEMVADMYNRLDRETRGNAKRDEKEMERHGHTETLLQSLLECAEATDGSI